jgi:outer membrane protein assembly factor BamB
VLVPGSFYLIAYDVADGRKVWWVSGLAFEMKATPVHDGTFVYISGTSASSFEDSYGRRIPAFAEVRDADANGDGRFARDELPDQLAKKWFRLLDLDGDSAIDGREWERYRLARQSAGGLSAFTLNGTGDVTSTNAAWHYDKAVPQLPSPLLYRGHILIVSDTGIATALDARTGAVLVQRRLQSVADNYFASPVAGDGKIFFAAESGKVSVAAADGALTALSEIDLAESIHATPAIAGGQLFVRTASALYCFGRKR